MTKHHTYDVTITWTGNDGSGTETYRSYRRDHIIMAEGKPAIAASSDPSFRGNPSRYNPEELLVASLSACHMLWYLHLCAVNGIRVRDYSDATHGIMEETGDGGGAFARVILRPRVAIGAGGDHAKAVGLHEDAHRLCFIARSVNFPVECAPEVMHVAG